MDQLMEEINRRLEAQNVVENVDKLLSAKVNQLVKEINAMKTMSAADTEQAEMKIKLEKKMKQINKLRKKLEKKERAASTLLTGINRLNNEPRERIGAGGGREEEQQPRVIRATHSSDRDDRIKRVAHTLLKLLKFMLEERMNEEVTSLAEIHKEEMSQLYKKLEIMSDKLTMSQLNQFLETIFYKLV